MKHKLSTSAHFKDLEKIASDCNQGITKLLIEKYKSRKDNNTIRNYPMNPKLIEREHEQ
tara:strand:+ start:192 stop:368 length:177 start_codon:yes stop_codon:yes gene_type:complete